MATTNRNKKKGRTSEGGGGTGGDSPIIIGGGGGGLPGRLTAPFVFLKFNHDNYVPNPDDRDSFENEEALLDLLEIDGTNQPGVNESSIIEISCVNPNTGRTSTITITGRPLSINFNPKDYKYDHTTNKHTSNKTPKPRQITKVVVATDGRVLYPPGSSTYPEITVHSKALT